jgi:hypothetical protein
MNPLQYIKDKHAQAPTTSSTLFAYWRQGLKDLQAQVLTLSHDGMKGHEEVGTAGSPTTLEIYRDRKDLNSPSGTSKSDKQPEPELG